VNWILFVSVGLGVLLISISFGIGTIREVSQGVRDICFLTGILSLFLLILGPMNGTDYGFTGNGIPKGITFKVLSEPIPVPQTRDVVLVLQYPTDTKSVPFTTEFKNKIATWQVPVKSLITQNDCPKSVKGTLIVAKISKKFGDNYLYCPTQKAVK
jgi:hypothetical protein